MDAAMSVAAARRFIPGCDDAETIFVPANFDGAGMSEDDVAVDISAGGRGIKGEQDSDGTVHSALASIVAQYATADEQSALERLVSFVDAGDSGQTAFDAHVVGLPQILAAFRIVGGRDGDRLVVERAEEILTGLLQMGLSKIRAEAEANMMEIVSVGSANVAVVVGAKERGTNSVLYGRGVHAIVYVDGNNLGATRPNSFTFRLDSEAVRAAVGNEDGWFFHPSGFLAARGSFKAPATTPSRVNPQALAEAVAATIAATLDK